MDTATDCVAPPMDQEAWGVSPHVHGTPAYATLANGRSFLYVWPEKSALQVFEADLTQTPLQFKFGGRSGNCVDSPTSGACAPAGGGNAMPGGFVSVVIDPSGTGIVFASVPAGTSDCQNNGTCFAAPGRLYAFDPVPDQSGSLHKLWDNSGETYGFAKFVPPTLANGRVYLATSTNEVRVYGMEPQSPPCGTGHNAPCLQ